MFEINIRRSIAASHVLKGYQGKCSQLHGHNWDVHVILCSPDVNDLGISVDFREVKQELDQLLKTLDHCHLNDQPAFQTTNPSTENLAKYIYECLKPRLEKGPVCLSRVTIYESRECSASYYEHDPR